MIPQPSPLSQCWCCSACVHPVQQDGCESCPILSVEDTHLTCTCIQAFDSSCFSLMLPACISVKAFQRGAPTGWFLIKYESFPHDAVLVALLCLLSSAWSGCPSPCFILKLCLVYCTSLPTQPTTSPVDCGSPSLFTLSFLASSSRQEALLSVCWQRYFCLNPPQSYFLEST